MYAIKELFYSAALRQKQGELIAAVELSDVSKSALLPYFIAAPASNKSKVPLTKAGVIDLLVGNLITHWPLRPCLFDTRFIKLDDDAGSDASWLAKMLERFRQFNGMVIPVADLRTDFYRVAAIGSHSRISKSGVALRISMTDLVRADLNALLETQIKNLSCTPSDCVLVLDLKDADLSQADEFAKFVAETLFRLHSLGPWAKVIVQATNFPLKNPAKDNSSFRIKRKEWDLWKAVLKIDRSISKFAIFGDFGADNAHIDFKGGGRPIPHLRYATADDWIISRGDRNQGYAVMKSVAERIVDSGNFAGDLFSAGDEYISARAKGLNGVGNPMMWRSVNMNHHMTFVVSQLGDLYGTPVLVNRERRHPVQERLFVDPISAKQHV